MEIASIKHLAFVLKCKTSETEINSICKAISDKEFKNDDFFYREIIKESTKDGKTKIRVINPSKGRLKLIQNSIKKNIIDSIRFPNYVQGANKGFSNISNACMHKGKKFKFTTDIKKFFPSITPFQVYSAFCAFGFKPEISRVLTMLTTYKGKLPQGASTSSHIANMVFNPIDIWINDFSKQNGITYSRYIDDVTLSSQLDFKNLLPVIINKIVDFGFVVSSQKTQYKHLLDITGISVSNNYMKPNKKFYENLGIEQSDDSKRGRMNYLDRVKNP